MNPALPAELGRILGRALEKDRNLRYQTATDLKTELLRLKRDIDSGGRRAAELHDSRPGAAAKTTEKSVAVLYFENLSGVKEDEYFRDGITEDIITELSKIRTLKIFPRPTILPYRDKAVTAQQVGRELSAAFVLGGSLRRAGNRLRINTQLMDAKTDFPVWSERYDREMADVFEVQDEIARKIAEALRVTLSPQEQQELAARPTENLQAYDLYLRGKSYARRLTRQDLEFALQMFENAVTLDPAFALAHAANAIFCAQYYANFQRDAAWGAAGQGRRRQGDRAPAGAARRAGGPGLDPLHRGRPRRRDPARPPGDRAQAQLRGGLLPAGPGAVRRRPLPGGGRHRRVRGRGRRRRLQRVRADHQRARGARQGGGARQLQAARVRRSRRTS